jgi:hypothetical protein
MACRGFFFPAPFHSRSDGPTTLQNAHGGLFVLATSASDLLRPNVLAQIACFAADEDFGDLYLPVSLLLEAPGLHCVANAMKHEPSRFLAHADGSVQFVGTDAVTVFGKHPQRR